MVEGGERLYNIFKDFVDWKVFIITPKIFDRINYKTNDEIEILHIEKRDDLIVWSR
ncbi:hypothetical protein [Lebetimonas sp. JH292]|uniref:hypothetical protein n=1 Tax=Lebetimonas sp. JH292 TaxID=990068 RepID=UPI0004B86791|nr:hypothetical protein [Lebetimonas sp. JH292]